MEAERAISSYQMSAHQGSGEAVSLTSGKLAGLQMAFMATDFVRSCLWHFMYFFNSQHTT